MKIRILLVAGLFLSAAAFGWDGATDASAWAELVGQVESNRVELADLIAQADTAGLSTDYAEVSLTVLERFQVFAQYDRSNPEFWSNAVASVWWGSKLPDAENYHIELPFDELQSCINLSDAAIAELEQQLSGGLVLQHPHDFSTGLPVLSNGVYLLNGKPSFPSTFTWMPEDEELHQAFGRIGTSFYQLTHLNPDGSVSSSYIDSQRNALAAQTADHIAPQQILLGGAVDDWMVETNPAVTDGGRYYVKYDTDSPQVRSWLTQLFEGFLPDVCGPGGSGDASRIHLLANEPNFATREGGWLAENRVSANTKERYKEWLETRYTNDISFLNSTYGTSYADFDAARDGLVLPISTSLQGGPIWYDWCRFNMDRVNDFFSFLKTGIQSQDASPASIKVLGGQMLASRDEGMDMEYLSGLMDVLGADNKLTPLGATDLNISDSLAWTNRYGMDWIAQSMTLDFMRSISPGKAFYDSEWHGLSSGRWRDLGMSGDYVRAAIWMGITHGISAMQAWYWPRGADGSMARGTVDGIIGSVLTQPEALDSYGRTFKELNAHSEKVHAFSVNERFYMLFYCEEAAIQDEEYLTQLATVYESLKLLNVPVSFATPTTISNLDVSAQTVIVPPTQFAADSSLASLQAFETAGGRIVQVNGTAATFSKNEHGSGRTVPVLSVYASLSFSSDIDTLAPNLETALSGVKPNQPFDILITDDGVPTYGVIALQTSDLDAAGDAVALINVSKEPRAVSLQADGADVLFRDLLTGRLSSGVFSMEPMDVRLLAPNDTTVMTVVQWGQPGGDPNIVTTNQQFVPFPTFSTYTYGNTANPVQGADYYPNSTNCSPVFNHATKNPYNTKQVTDNAQYGDYISTAKNDPDYTAMVVWENFLADAHVLAGLELETRVNDSADTASQFRWLIRKGSGNWYASAPMDTSGSFETYSTDDPGSLSWFEFSPHSNAVASVGGAVSITMNGVDAVGYYATFQQPVENVKFRSSETRYFKAAAYVAEPATGWEQFVARYSLSGAADDDADYDGRSDLYEYALGGDPTNLLVQGEAPAIIIASNGAVRFSHLQIEQDDSGITYLPQWTDNLITGGWSSVFGWATNQPSAVSNYTEAAYEVIGNTNSSLYFRLDITQP